LSDSADSGIRPLPLPAAATPLDSRAIPIQICRAGQIISGRPLQLSWSRSMRSAEESGVSAKGFGVPRHGDRAHRVPARLHSPLRHLADISPVTMAVGATALLAALLFIVVDTVRT